MKLKANCNKYTFDEKRHKHYINGREVAGTTSIVGVIDKPALMPWAVKISMEYLKNNLTDLTKLDDVIEESKKQPNEAKKSAGRFGTVVHALCEHFNNTGEVLPIDSPKLPQEVLDIQIDKSQQKKAVKLTEQYKKWFEDNKVKIHYVEQNVFSETYFVGGIFDMVLEIDGKMYLGDFKTSSGVYPSQFVQMGGYEIQLEEMMERGYIDNIQIDGYIVIHIPRKGSLKEHRIVDTNNYKRAFRACLYIYRLVNDQKWAL